MASFVSDPTAIKLVRVSIILCTLCFSIFSLGTDLIVFSFRHQLNSKKIKVVEQPIRKPSTYPAESLLVLLSGDSNNEDFRDETCTMPLSKSLEGGSMNVCKIRVLKFVQTERIPQGYFPQMVKRVKLFNSLILSLLTIPLSTVRKWFFYCS